MRDELLAEAKKLGYIPADQPSVKPEYPHEWVTRWTTNTGEQLMLRPIQPTDHHHLERHFYSLSQQAVGYRFRRAMKMSITPCYHSFGCRRIRCSFAFGAIM